MILLSKPVISVLIGFLVLYLLTYLYFEFIYKERIIREIEEEFLKGGGTGNDKIDRKIIDNYLRIKFSKK